MTHTKPTETSPLLPKPATDYLEAGDAPNGPLPNGSEHHEASANGKANGSIKDDNHDDEERQQGVDSERVNQYEGMPEVKKQLKYILPAIAIGVSLFFDQCSTI